ncbi:hypothetical protein [Rhodopila sp.]|uniref:hypothetical protein n=1 Tax=Rhodopila sp. TaxID=2480087 RepID=UPI003D132DA6
MLRLLSLLAILSIAACSGPKLPPPNTAQATYDGRARAVQVTISSFAMPTSASLVSASGARYPAAGLSLLSSPHVLYNQPPTIGLGIGGFGFSGCCGFGSGLGVGVPVGKPTPAEVSNQYVASAVIPLPADYMAMWATYHVEVFTGGPPLTLPAPTPVAR